MVDIAQLHEANARIEQARREALLEAAKLTEALAGRPRTGPFDAEDIVLLLVDLADAFRALATRRPE